MSLREDADRPTPVVDLGDDERAETPARPAAVSPPVAAPAQTGLAPARKRPLRRAVLLAALALALGGGAYAGWQWWTVGRFFIATDDAYVQADISVLAAKVSGYLEAVPVVNGLSVKKGDIIAKLDDGDYRLALQAAQDKLATQESTIAADRPAGRGRAGAGRPGRRADRRDPRRCRPGPGGFRPGDADAGGLRRQVAHRSDPGRP